MKYYNLLLGITAMVVIAGAILRITHIIESSSIIIFGLFGGSLVQGSHIKALNKRINELEQDSKEQKTVSYSAEGG